MDDFQDGAPPVNEQPQDRGANLTPSQRAMLEQFEKDEAFRRQAEVMWHQVQAGVVPAGQYQQQPAQQPQVETELAKKLRRHAEVRERKQELISLSVTQQRNWTDAEAAEFGSLERELPTLESDINRLRWEEQDRRDRELREQQNAMQFQQAVSQRFAQVVGPKVQGFNVSAAEKTRLYNKAWELFTTHPFFTQINDVQAADLLINATMDNLIANHGAPKQRAAQPGRADERMNDIDSPQPDGQKDRFSDLPPEVASQLRARYGNRAIN